MATAIGRATPSVSGRCFVKQPAPGLPPAGASAGAASEQRCPASQAACRCVLRCRPGCLPYRQRRRPWSRGSVEHRRPPDEPLGHRRSPGWPSAESVAWSATCRCKGRKACSRMRTSGAQEPSGFSGTVLVRWLVKGLELKDVSGKSLAHQHMHETRRENPSKGK